MITLNLRFFVASETQQVTKKSAYAEEYDKGRKELYSGW